MKQRISRVSAKNDEDRILGERTDLDGSGLRNECLAEQEAFKLKPGTWTEISQVKNGEELPRNREQHLWEAWIRRSFVLLRKNQSILNKAKASISRLSSNRLSSGEPSLTPLCSHRTWDILYALLGQYHLFMPSKCQSGLPCPLEAHFVTQQVFTEHLLCAGFCRHIGK